MDRPTPIATRRPAPFDSVRTWSLNRDKFRSRRPHRAGIAYNEGMPDATVTDADSRGLFRSFQPVAFGEELPPYKPRPWLFDGRLQTIGVPLSKPSELSKQFGSKRYVLPLDDGTGDSTDLYHYWPSDREPATGDRPTFLLIHGLGGHAHSAYIARSAKNLLAAGHDVLMPNFRGAGTARDLARVLHHPGRSDDLDVILRAMEKAAPELATRDTILVGYSLGGHLVLKFLADFDVSPEGSHSQIQLAVTVSAPLSLDGTSKRLSETLNWPFNKYLLHKIRHEVLRENAVLTEREREQLKAARTVRDVDNNVTAPRLGFEDAEAYYAANSAIDDLGDIALPTLMIHSLDDPFVANEDYDCDAIGENDLLDVILLPDGGHVGFFTGQSGPRWIDQALLRLAEC